MKMFRWLFRKGIASAISTDIIGKYFIIKSEQPEHNECDVVTHTWNLWLSINEKHICSERNLDKIVRLDIIKEKMEGRSNVGAWSKQHQTLLSLYENILYIETELTLYDGKIWRDAMSVFVDKAKKHGLDFSKEYESYTSLVKRLIQ